MASDRESTVEDVPWHELLVPFIGVKKLHIGSSLTPELSQAFQLDAEGLIELLPVLQELQILLETDHAKKAFSEFVETRESVGRPVHLLALPILHAKVIEANFKYILHIDLPYRRQALDLIFICQTLSKKHTLRSYDELRR
jgi:hypothetical protein